MLYLDKFCVLIHVLSRSKNIRYVSQPKSQTDLRTLPTTYTISRRILLITLRKRSRILLKTRNDLRLISKNSKQKLTSTSYTTIYFGNAFFNPFLRRLNVKVHCYSSKNHLHSRLLPRWLDPLGYCSLRCYHVHVCMYSQLFSIYI